MKSGSDRFGRASSGRNPQARARLIFGLDTDPAFLQESRPCAEGLGASWPVRPAWDMGIDLFLRGESVF